jgi:hypothetical protein
MNAIIPFPKIAVSGATTEDYEAAAKEIELLFKNLRRTVEVALLDTSTAVIGIAANVKENTSSRMRIDDIKWRFAELNSDLEKGLKDLCGDIVGRIQNAGDIQQLWGE